MKVTLLYFFIASIWISCRGQGESNQNSAPNNGKLPYETLPIVNRISNYGLENVGDSEDPTLVELQFLRKRDSFCFGEQVIEPITHAVGGLFGTSTDVCEKDFSSTQFFSSKHIEIPKKSGIIEGKPIEITRYNVDPSNINFKVHKCSCEIKGDSNQEAKSYCIDGSAYVTEGVNGSESFFILKKSDNSDNLNLKAQVTLSNSPALPTQPNTPETQAGPANTPAAQAGPVNPPVAQAPANPPSA